MIKSTCLCYPQDDVTQCSRNKVNLLKTKPQATIFFVSKPMNLNWIFMFYPLNTFKERKEKKNEDDKIKNWDIFL